MVFLHSELWFKFLTLIYWSGLIAVGIFLILCRRSPFSKRSRYLIFCCLGLLIASPIVLDIYIRHERQALQTRAKEFLARPVPSLFNTNDLGGYIESQNGNVLTRSRTLIERYAKTGRIRWSAAIQGQFATAPFGIAACEAAAGTNEEAQLYIADCKSILGEERRMGFWQWIEDTIEMKRTIPEIEEENQVDKFVQKLDGIWTNSFGIMTISPNGTFSAIWHDQTHTNIFKGTEVFRARDAVLIVYPDNPPNVSDSGEKDFTIIHVDDHNLIYALDGQTNSMNR